MFRLRNVLTFHDLLKLLQLRLRYGIEKWLPVYHRTLDGTFEVLPGIVYKNLSIRIEQQLNE